MISKSDVKQIRITNQRKGKIVSKQAKSRSIPVHIQPGLSEVPANLTILHRRDVVPMPKEWVVLDHTKKDITVAFQCKPDSATISRLNAAGFSRSMRGAWCWTKRQNAASLAFAERLAGVQMPAARPLSLAAA